MKFGCNGGAYLAFLSLGVGLVGIACSGDSSTTGQPPAGSAGSAVGPVAGAAGSGVQPGPGLVGQGGTGGSVAPPTTMAGAGGSAAMGGMGGSVSVAGSAGAAMAGAGMGGAGMAMPGVWPFSKTITLDTTAAGANVSENVENYPLAVQLNADNFDFAQAQMTGADIRFFDAADMPLPHAIEHWDAAGQQAAIWVYLDVVNGNDNTQTIVMKWGNSTSEDASDSQAVFKMEDGFYGVWHLNEDGNTDDGGYQDASDHEAHATGVGLAAGSQVDARVGKGTHLDNPDGQNTARWIRVSGDKKEQFNTDNTITVSVWALAYSYPIYSYETIMCKGDTSWTLQRVQYDRNGYQSCVRTPGYHACSYNFDGQDLVTEEWLHFMLVLDEPVQTLYINGERNSSVNDGPWNKGDHDLGIGNQTQNLGGRRQWDGILDEARVMHGARGEAWAKLEFESQKENQTLLTFGATATAP